MNFVLDPLDFVRFAPVALKSATKKGILQEVRRGNDTQPGFYCLFGNMLLTFEQESDPNSLTGLIFLESSKCKIVNSVYSMLAITTVGGRTVNLTTAQVGELQEWMEAIESNKHIQMTRRLDDIESTLVQLQHAEQAQTQVQIEYDRTIMEYKQQVAEQQKTIESMQATIDQLQNDKQDLNRQLKQSESERLLLLKSRGITPKSLPQWALLDATRKSVTEPLKRLKIWTGTWNLAGKEPFAGMEKDRAKRLLQPFVPEGYDLYALSVQDCPSDSVFECFDALQTGEGYRKLKVTSRSAEHDGVDPSRIYGRGDGTLKSLKFTGLVLYARSQLIGDVKLVNMVSFPLSSTQSRGAVAAVVHALGRNIVFISTHLDRKSNDLRRDQYQTLFMALGSGLAEPDFHLNDQFHHVLWMGDLGYTLVDTSGNTMPPETATTMLQDGRLLRTLFESHDQLNQEKRSQHVFFQCREPTPFPNFYPTYKKVENRAPVNYHVPGWTRQVYVTQVKEPFYYGGKTREWTPAFPDRILFYSMSDLAEDLVPESVPADMSINMQSQQQQQQQQQQGGDRGSGGGSSMVVRVDNYRAINDGEGFTVSDHSPVFATYLLRLRHDFSDVISASQSAQGSTTASSSSAASSSLLQTPTRGGAAVRHLLSALTITDNNTLPEGAQAPIPPPLPAQDATSSANFAANGSTNTTTNDFSTPERIKLVDAFASPETSNNHSNPANGASAAFSSTLSTSHPLVHSLLPHGVYRVRLAEMKMVWGVHEEAPCSVSLLFPAPYEAVAGERFVEFQSETVSVSSPHPSAYSASQPNSPTKAPKQSNNNASSSSSMRLSFRSPARGNALQQDLLAAATTPGGAGAGWRRSGTSKTGTCMRLETTSTNYGSNSTSSSNQRGGARSVAPLVLTWRGDEPLDRLHICIKASMTSKAISAPNGSSASSSSSSASSSSAHKRQSLSSRSASTSMHSPYGGGSGGGSGGSGAGGGSGGSDSQDDWITGHCSVSLEQLCRVAVAQQVQQGGGSSCATTVARLLINRGRPMYNIDTKHMQVSSMSRGRGSGPEDEEVRWLFS